MVRKEEREVKDQPTKSTHDFIYLIINPKDLYFDFTFARTKKNESELIFLPTTKIL